MTHDEMIEAVAQSMRDAYGVACDEVWVKWTKADERKKNEWRQMARAAIRVIAPAMQADAAPVWRPIETAPKDGTDALVCVTYNLPDGELDTIQWVDRRSDGEAWDVWPSRLDIPFVPTHWMPLPAPPVVTRVSTSNPVVDHETGNTSDKLRDALEVWRDAYDAFTDFYHHTTEKDPARVIEADRQATRAALVAEIIAWLRKPRTGMGYVGQSLAEQIKAKWGKP